MVYALVDDWLYVDVNGKQSTYGRQEAQRNLKGGIKTVIAAFLDFQTKKVFLQGQRKNHQEALVNSAFDNDYIIVQEKLSSDSMQVIGAKQNKIEEIYNYFKGVRVNTLVPYAAAIRAFLKSRNLLDSHRYTIFLDDLGNQAVITFFENMYFSSPRRITMRDTGYMMSEIKRSWQNFLSDRLDREQALINPFILISNNQEWLSVFEDQEFLRKENAVYVDVDFAVLEGLKSAKFTMHFSLVEEVVRQKKRNLWRGHLNMLLVCSSLILLGLGSYTAFKNLKQKKLLYYQDMQAQEDKYRQQLKIFHQKKFLSLLSKNKTINYPKVYFDFVSATPQDYFIDNIQFQKISDNWQFQGLVYPKDEGTLHESFRRKSFFANAQISSIIFNKVLGQQIRLQIDVKDKDL